MNDAPVSSNSMPPAQSLQRSVLQILLLVLAAVLVLWLLYALRKIILLLIFTVLFCYLIAPLVNVLVGPRRFGPIVWRVPRAMAIFAVYVLLFYGAVQAIDWLAPLLSDQLGALAENAPAYLKQLDQYSQWLARLPGRYRLPLRWQQEFNDWLAVATTNVVDWLQSFALSTVSLTLYLDWLVLIPVLGFFFLKDGRHFRQHFLAALPKADMRVRVADFLQDVSETLAAYIRAQLLACLLIGVIVGTGLRLLGASYPLVLGVAAGLLEFIPIVGPVIIGAISVLVASFASLKIAGAVLVFLVILRLIHDYVVYPRLIARGVELHPVLVILAVICGAELGGLTGVVLGVPVMALLLVCFRHWRELQVGRIVAADEATATGEYELVSSLREP
ncbi:MAG: AI-2E family transporter [Acidobacteria bacterium]|nr:AI-2E family transporter [Acidobacteriota bacterium]MBI3428199.1 AI-2E family transporter [Acidobacteriota bacterium]